MFILLLSKREAIVLLFWGSCLPSSSLKRLVCLAKVGVTIVVSLIWIFQFQYVYWRIYSIILKCILAAPSGLHLRYHGHHLYGLIPIFRYSVILLWFRPLDFFFSCCIFMSVPFCVISYCMVRSWLPNGISISSQIFIPFSECLISLFLCCVLYGI